ncbi:hypothetical protein BESB_009070 [Besnoitia besnoiti]|uniref:Uncharacterized protein n=1 Tax=Besnoitia besnoiti TaxID=94643 RepID=A0A2A9MKP5_BESBE|nr:hypothetical protein BESB_009070 [Besnoitia besnoiti]PFH38565.1 hypothetical protein BESB_009070 [Besnoitia besnoiti]
MVAPSAEEASDALVAGSGAERPASSAEKRPDGEPARHTHEENVGADAGSSTREEGRPQTKGRPVCCVRDDTGAGQQAESTSADDHLTPSDGDSERPSGADAETGTSDPARTEKTDEKVDRATAGEGAGLETGRESGKTKLQTRQQDTGRKPGHSRLHFEETSHTHALELGTDCVWDFVSEGYVHLVLQKRCQEKAARLKKAELEASPEGPEAADGGQESLVCRACQELHSDGVTAGDGAEKPPRLAADAEPEKRTRTCALCGAVVALKENGDAQTAAATENGPHAGEGAGRPGPRDSDMGLPTSPPAETPSPLSPVSCKSGRELGSCSATHDRGIPGASWKKVSGWVLEFNQMLAASLDSQRDYYENRLHRMAQLYAPPLAECRDAVVTAQQTVAELQAQVSREEEALAAIEAEAKALAQEADRLTAQHTTLQKLHAQLEEQASEARQRQDEEKRKVAERIQERLAEIEDLKQQIRDVCFHVQASAQLSAVPDAKDSYMLLGQRASSGSSRGGRAHAQRDAAGPGGSGGGPGGSSGGPGGSGGGPGGGRRGERRRGGGKR